MVSNQNTLDKIAFSEFSQNRPESLEYMRNILSYERPKASKKIKRGVFLTTLIGVSTALALTLKGKGYSLSPSKILKTLPKDWGIFNVKYDSEKKEVEKLVGRLAIGSVGGGLIGGALFDKKENMKAKYREAIIQLVGNISMPLLCVSGGMRLFNKFEPQILKALPALKGKAASVPSVLASAASLVAGIFLGNKVGNFINKEIFHVDDHRKIKLADMSPHIDDVCLATSLVAAESKIGPQVTRLIPAALMVAGYSAGTAQERPERLHHNERV